MSIVDRIFEKVDKTKRAYGMDSCKDVYLALGHYEFDELMKVSRFCGEHNEDFENPGIKTFYGLEIVLMKDYHSYLELLRKL